MERTRCVNPSASRADDQRAPAVGNSRPTNTKSPTNRPLRPRPRNATVPCNAQMVPRPMHAVMAHWVKYSSAPTASQISGTDFGVRTRRKYVSTRFDNTSTCASNTRSESTPSAFKYSRKISSRAARTYRACQPVMLVRARATERREVPAVDAGRSPDEALPLFRGLAGTAAAAPIGLTAARWRTRPGAPRSTRLGSDLRGAASLGRDAGPQMRSRMSDWRLGGASSSRMSDRRAVRALFMAAPSRRGSGRPRRALRAGAMNPP